MFPILKMYEEADAIYLARAIVEVYFRWIETGKKPGSDRIINSTRKHRPELISEIVEEWERIVSADPFDDLFPYHEDYVVRKWIDFRKLSDPLKVACREEFRGM